MIVAAGGDIKIMAKLFPLALKPSTRSWLMNLSEGSIKSWIDLCELFVSAYQSGYKRTRAIRDMHAVIQKPGETLLKYVQHFCHVSHSIPDAMPATIITAFQAGVRDPKMCEKLNTRTFTSTSEFYTLDDKCARAEEGRLVPGEAMLEVDNSGQAKKNSGKHKSREVFAVGPETEPRHGKRAK
jgi:hypothetical protein